MLIDRIIGDLGGKKKYREYKQRITQLPAPYREAAGALERYLLNLGPSGDSTSLIVMLSDLADLLEQSAAADIPIRDLVGTDPVDFAETFMDNYGGGSWIRKERDRLTKSIDRAVGEETRS